MNKNPIILMDLSPSILFTLNFLILEKPEKENINQEKAQHYLLFATTKLLYYYLQIKRFKSSSFAASNNESVTFPVN